jgi:hypothetical protein
LSPFEVQIETEHVAAFVGQHDGYGTAVADNFVSGDARWRIRWNFCHFEIKIRVGIEDVRIVFGLPVFRIRKAGRFGITKW